MRFHRWLMAVKKRGLAATAVVNGDGSEGDDGDDGYGFGSGVKDF